MDLHTDMSIFRSSLKVLVIHNSYQKCGGEDAVVLLESDMLKRHGNLASLLRMSNDRVAGFLGKVRAAVGVVFSLRSYRLVRHAIREFEPDVVHVHNFFPLISPSVFYACRAERVPVVLTLHNYRIVCPTALLMHNGEVTERSLKGGPWWAIRARVYRDSFVGTFFLCLMISLHRRIGTWITQVDRFVVLSEFARLRFECAGLPCRKIAVKPNCIDIEDSPVGSRRSGLLFVGRLSPEKGIEVLLDAYHIASSENAKCSIVLKIAGDGPLVEQVKQSELVWLGRLSSVEVREQMRTASALVLPSVWYEGFPMVLVEAYACGLPIIASRIGALVELVEHGVTGLLFNPGDADDLAFTMRWAREHPVEMRRMGKAARQRYEERYTLRHNYDQLMTIYRDAIDEAGKLASRKPCNGLS